MREAIASVRGGRWGVAVSGGADSVATLHLLSARARSANDLELVVVHVDHELRGRESEADAQFVEGLARELGLGMLLRRRAEVEARMKGTALLKQRGLETRESNGLRAVDKASAGLGAYLRQLRLEVYREAMERFGLAGVVLGHHADDLAETMLLRILRGSPRSGTLGLAPLRSEQVVSGVRLLRPMLGIRRARLREFLEQAGLAWREDASNANDSHLRNRVRRLLADRPAVTEALLRLASSAARAEAELDGATPALDASPRLSELASLPEPIRRRAARRWMIARGVPEAGAGPKAVDALVALVDAAGPRAADLPGGIRVTRRGERLVAGEDGEMMNAECGMRNDEC